LFKGGVVPVIAVFAVVLLLLHFVGEEQCTRYRRCYKCPINVY